MIVGITGTIGSGKSTLSKYYKELGYKIIDADNIAFELLRKGKAGYNEVRKYFPEVMENDEIVRSKLAKIIFDNADRKQCLDSILHPLILKEMQNESTKYLNELLFWDVPLLFESGFDKFVDKSICVYATKDILVERLIKRDNLSFDDIEKRITNQMPADIKKHKADYILDNSEDYENLVEQANEILSKLNELNIH